MDLFVLPVINGVLPYAEGGIIQGVFMDYFTAQAICRLGVGGHVLLCPVQPDGVVYAVGVIGRIEEFWDQELRDEAGNPLKGFFALLRGRGRAMARSMKQVSKFIIGQNIHLLDFKKLRSQGQPVICGSGWAPQGGYTDFELGKGPTVTVYGNSIEDGKGVSLSADLGNLVTGQQAHTIEHGIIRSLQIYALCTPKTLLKSIENETNELKRSIDLGIKLKLPQLFGQTESGHCGNPMTRLAQFYLAQEFVNQIENGRPVWQSLENARQKTLSQVFNDLQLSLQPGLEVMQGLKKGMFHDDSGLRPGIIKSVLARFPVSPLEK